MRKKVLVTGVARGIGRSIAEKFIEEGYDLYGTFHRSEGVARELEQKYGDDRVCLFGPYDFQNLDDTMKLLCKLQHYSFDSIVCNAGMFPDNDEFNEFNLKYFQDIMNCNFYTPLILTTGLKDNVIKGGSIVIISSNDAAYGTYASISYSASKAALISLMKSLSVNYGSRSVRVNAVSPGTIDTDMNTSERMILAPYFNPISRFGYPSDVAAVVYFLASEGAAFVNGVNILIDGGYSNTNIFLKAESDPELSSALSRFIRNDKAE